VLRTDVWSARLREVAAGATAIPVVMPFGFAEGQTTTVGSGTEAETVSIASVRHFEGASIVLFMPLKQAHGRGSQVFRYGADAYVGVDPGAFCWSASYGQPADTWRYQSIGRS